MISIFEYTDYRKYLKDYFQFRKNSGEGYTFRQMSEELGFASPNFFKLVMENKRNLGATALKKTINKLGLKKKEREYFSYLVYFDHAKTTVERNYYFGLIASFRTRSSVAKINADQYDYYSNWYIPVIRELIVGKKARGLDFKELAGEVQPVILPKQAKKAVRILEEMNMIKKDASGRCVQASRLLETEKDIQSLAIRNFNREMIKRADESIETSSPEEREVSCLTVKISESGMKKMKKRIQEFKEELMQIVGDDKDVDRVYQVNFQLFPVSKKK
jgi:uncharacterized protein (TIGR02147 family)